LSPFGTEVKKKEKEIKHSVQMLPIDLSGGARIGRSCSYLKMSTVRHSERSVLDDITDLHPLICTIRQKVLEFPDEPPEWKPLAIKHLKTVRKSLLELGDLLVKYCGVKPNGKLKHFVGGYTVTE
jgi:hypothetical protein